jgi:DNA-directed RNA polymerase II subunit RPB9
MRHEIASTVGATAGVTAEVAQDPTVGPSNPSLHSSLPEEIPCCTMCGQDIVCIECGEDWAPGFALEAEDEQPPVDLYGEDHTEFAEYDDDFVDFDDDEDMDDVPW